MRNSIFGLVAAVTIVAAATGCAGWLARQGPKPACVATYTRVPGVPNAELGVDGCGNSWLRLEDGCFVLSVEGDSLIKLPKCPAEGDTFAVGK